MNLQTLRGWKCGEPAGGLNCSLVVPTYRRPAEIVHLLDALLTLAELPREVVIVDGSPGKETEDRIECWTRNRELPFELRYVSCPPGLTRQRNAGIDCSTASIVFFLDDDATPRAGFFAAICRVFEDDRGREIGGVAGYVLSDESASLCWKWRLRCWLGLAPQVAPLHYDKSGTSVPASLLRPFHGVLPVDLMPGCSFALRRDVFARHRFSTFFQGYSQGEDVEMSLRTRRDWCLLCCGDAPVVHTPAPGGRPRAFAKGRMEVRNRVFIWKRHVRQPPWRPRLRFALDIVFCIAFDVAQFVRRPWRPHHLAHAVGMTIGVAGCIVAPPACSEPPAKPEFQAEWSVLQRV